MVSLCCSAAINPYVPTRWCEGCNASVCAECAQIFEREDGYGDGEEVRGRIICKDCWTEGDKE